MTAAAPNPDEPAASVSLRRLAGTSGDQVSFADIMEAAGSRVHGFALLILSLPETIPLPLPSASLALGVPLMLVSLHLAIFGEGNRWPKRLAKVHVSRKVVAAIADKVVPVLERIERMSRVRWKAVARHERLVGVLGFYLSLILFLPVPFFNLVPALCLSAVALGLIQRDGLLIAAGATGALIITVLIVLSVTVASDLLQGVA